MQRIYRVGGNLHWMYYTMINVAVEMMVVEGSKSGEVVTRGRATLIIACFL